MGKKQTTGQEHVKTPTTPKQKNKPINFYDPFKRADPKLLEQMYRAAQKEKLKQLPEALL